MQVRVVGSGPAGLMAADVLSAAGHQVTILDHHGSPARKFLLAGRGGLNLTHSEPLDQLLTRYGPARAWLEPMIRSFPPQAVRDWCHGLGVGTFVGSSGRVFPVGLKTSPLLRALLHRLAQRGVQLHTRTPWPGFDGVPTLLALGGASWPETGSDAVWVTVFQQAGISVQPFAPSNVRQRVAWSPLFAGKFAGHPIKNVAVSTGSETLRGEIVISRDGIEGGPVYALSRSLRGQPHAHIRIDLKPDMPAAEVARRLAMPRGKDSGSTFLRKRLGLAPAAIALMRETGSADPKDCRISIAGSGSLNRAISSAGGISMQEFDSALRLRKQPSTWVAGEMLDWDAPTGGYLLQASLSTAQWAAENMAREIVTDFR